MDINCSRYPNGPRCRRLRFEPLESRLALAAMSLGDDAGTLAAYLAQPIEMGPILEQFPTSGDLDASPTSTEPPSAESSSPAELPAEPLATDAVFTAVGNLEAEGEDWLPGLPGMPGMPLFLNFFAHREDGGWVHLYGQLIGLNIGGTQIFFGGLFQGQTTTCNATGDFSLFVPDPGISGFVTANTGLSSIVTYLF